MVSRVSASAALLRAEFHPDRVVLLTGKQTTWMDGVIKNINSDLNLTGFFDEFQYNEFLKAYVLTKTKDLVNVPAIAEEKVDSRLNLERVYVQSICKHSNMRLNNIDKTTRETIGASTYIFVKKT